MLKKKKVTLGSSCCIWWYCLCGNPGSIPSSAQCIESIVATAVAEVTAVAWIQSLSQEIPPAPDVTKKKKKCCPRCAVSGTLHLSQCHHWALLLSPTLPIDLSQPLASCLTPQDQIICGEEDGKGHLILPCGPSPLPPPPAPLIALPFVRQLHLQELDLGCFLNIQVGHLKKF